MAGEEEEEVHLSRYRPAKPLPFELRQHCAIYFEERLYTQALSLLFNILTCGTVASSPAYVPTPQYLAVAATLLVHPSTTTRARTTEEQAAAPAALQLLRLTNNLVGPVSARFDTAFAFTHFESSRYGGRRRHGRVADHDEGGAYKRMTEGGEIEPLDNLDLATSGSLWSRAENFWYAAGWAFNCSTLHPRRWERWQLWLQFMCEALEDDWEERRKLSSVENTNNETKSASESEDETRSYQLLESSLIFKYLATGSTGYGRNRRILRAIFANGSPTSTNEFREVFKNELKELKVEGEDKPKKREVDVNVYEEVYGDYLLGDKESSEEGEDSNNGSRRTKRRISKKNDNGNSGDVENGLYKLPDTIYANGGVMALGGYESLALRQRLLHLLSEVSQHLPKLFMPLDDLYGLFVEHIRHLPLPIFQAFVSPSALPFFSSAAQTTLCEILLFSMRESSAPSSNEPYLTQTKLEECFLPYAANTASCVDNAKISILLESCLILLAESGLLEVTSTLKQAVTMGIETRTDKAQIEIRRSEKTRKLEDIEWSWLIESGERLIWLIEEILLKEAKAT